MKRKKKDTLRNITDATLTLPEATRSYIETVGKGSKTLDLSCFDCAKFMQGCSLHYEV